MRLAITGLPRTGKSTAFPNAFHADTLKELPWSEQSDKLVEMMSKPGPWEIEGCAVVRALRKMCLKGIELPDRVIWFYDPLEELTPGQKRMAKGIQTIFDEVSEFLELKGILRRFGCCKLSLPKPMVFVPKGK